MKIRRLLIINHWQFIAYFRTLRRYTNHKKAHPLSHVPESATIAIAAHKNLYENKVRIIRTSFVPLIEVDDQQDDNDFG